MTFPCEECNSIFNEKRNLMQHMKNRHGLKKFKCNFCDYRSNDRKTLKRHENDKHKHELFKCLQCDYRSARKDMLMRHIRAIHMEKNILSLIVFDPKSRSLPITHCFYIGLLF